MLIKDKTGRSIDFQPTELIEISNLDSENFTIENNAPFLIKNDGDDIFLDVKLLNMTEFINTRFHQGYNEDVVIEIKSDAELMVYDLKAAK